MPHSFTPEWKYTIHRTADSRPSDGGRLYWKKTLVFMWPAKKGRRAITTHAFYFSSWPEVRGNA
jgi:hypothetical protein